MSPKFQLVLSIIYPIGFALFPVLSLYAVNADQAIPSSLGIGCLASIAIALILLSFSRLLLGDTEKGALLTSLGLLLFFTYGHMHTYLTDFLSERFGHFTEIILLNINQKFDRYLHLPLSLLLATILVRAYLKLSREPAYSPRIRTLSQLLAMTSLCLVAFQPIQIFFNYAQSAMYNVKSLPVSDVSSSATSSSTSATTSSRLDYSPDIYYIILDGYAREDILKKHYSYDNHDFLHSLQAQGFRVIDDAMSNYAYTFFSLASTLNMRYLNDVSDAMGAHSNDLRIPYAMIKDNLVARSLKDKGYRVVHLRTSWSGTQTSNVSDIEIGNNYGVGDDEFLRILIRTTWLKMFDLTITKDLAASHLANFHALENLPRADNPQLQSPKFVFAHILLPHHPFIFNADGGVRKHVDLSESFQEDGWDNRSEYLEQLKFVNSAVSRIVESILTNSANPPIIILQSDHGPKVVPVSSQNEPKGEAVVADRGVKNRSLTEREFAERVHARMGILLAVHFPDGAREILYPGMSPVNLFRGILRHYFHDDLPKLEDRAYYSHFHKPYKFFDELTQVPIDSEQNNNMSQ